MASGSDNQPIDFTTTIKLLDGDIHTQIMGGSGTNSRNKELCRTMRRTMYGYNKNETHHVFNAHVAFLNAGSNLIRTNTYHALYPYLNSLDATMNEDNYKETVAGAVDIARESIRDYCNKNSTLQSSLNIVGTCGCFDDETMNSLSPDDLKTAHRQRISILEKKGINIVSLEDIRDYNEAIMILDVMREFPNIKSLVMFDGNNHLNHLKRCVTDFYYIHRPRIAAIGLKNIHDLRANKFCENMIKGRKMYLIPLVMCTNKVENSWNPINVENNAPVKEWQKFGICYIGGGENVKPEDIASVGEKLRTSSTSRQTFL